MTVAWLETRDVPMADLTRHPGNARRGNMEQIRASIRRHGQYRALVARDTGHGLVILAGNHTRDALEAEGQKTARCEIITCSEDEAQRILVADNRISDLAGNDNELLAQLLAGLGDDLTGTGYDENDVTTIMRLGGFLSDEGSNWLDDLTSPLGHSNPGGLEGLDGDEPPAPGSASPPPAGNSGGWVPVTWTVTGEQRTIIQHAVNDARQRWGLATSAEAITEIARAYLSGIPAPEHAK